MSGYARWASGVLGVALMGVGVALVVGTGDMGSVAVWLAGAIVLHDGLIAPLVLGAGLLWGGTRACGPVRGPVRGRVRGSVRGRVRGPVRGPVRGAFTVAGCLTMVALPVLLRPGTPANSSVLPLDYVRGWLLSLGAVVVVTGAVIGVRVLRRGQRRRS
ncbi:hypothetical protein [Streptomyces sp. NBC_01014]|uniref:hypothetical protein n=1 Tax=Streptomyces sp. NBC_01014 TaxID=2903719 RepID=UPI00386C7C99|nr:hypothetical protein OG282_16900 [Streptomyces sp. NBC_01014]